MARVVARGAYVTDREPVRCVCNHNWIGIVTVKAVVILQRNLYLEEMLIKEQMMWPENTTTVTAM